MDAEQLNRSRKLAWIAPPFAPHKTSSGNRAVEHAARANIRPHFQPIVDGELHSIYAYEALLRMPGYPSSDALFRRWEITGDVATIDAAMVRRVRTTLQTKSYRASVTVNASALTVALAPKPYLAEITQLASVAERVVVEVTETFPVLQFQQLVSFAEQCRERGALFALDDCTSHHEYCNEQALRALRPDLIKLDGAMFASAFKDADSAQLRSIADLAAGVGALVVAEHVETASMADFALASGAQLLQGYLFGAAAVLPDVAVRSIKN